jgi:hypothetical protein
MWKQRAAQIKRAVHVEHGVANIGKWGGHDQTTTLLAFGLQIINQHGWKPAAQARGNSAVPLLALRAPIGK